MIVVDTSVWIDYLKGVLSAKTDLLDSMLEKETILIGDVILMEILQGIKSQQQFKSVIQFLQAFPSESMINPALAVTYANMYRTLRRRGNTIRKSNDVIIAGYCVEHGVPLLQQDRNFVPFAEVFGLQLL